MSVNSVAFLQKWMKEFVTDADRGGGSIRAAMLASQCREDATVFGISIDDEPQQGSVESIIYARMQMIKADEVKFWNVWSNMTKKIPKH